MHFEDWNYYEIELTDEDVVDEIVENLLNNLVLERFMNKQNPEINWNALANTNGTLVFLMGVANLQKISSNLIKEGKSKDTPVALISWAKRSKQRVITST